MSLERIETAGVPFPVIVGVPRSGTTMLRMMLDSHSDLAIPPETGFLLGPHIRAITGGLVQTAEAITKFPDDAPAWADFGIDEAAFLRQAKSLPTDARLGDLLRVFYRLYAQAHGKTRAGDKTPSYLLCMPELARALPEARFIHIIRDGRDVAVSWSKTWFAPTRDRTALVNIWAEQISKARRSATGLAYREVKFADLVRQPATVLEQLCNFVDLGYQPQMLEYFKRASLRLAEHKARYRVDGTVMISQQDRHLQQFRIASPPSPERLGVWQSEMDPQEIRRIDQPALLLLNEIEGRA